MLEFSKSFLFPTLIIDFSPQNNGLQSQGLQSLVRAPLPFPGLPPGAQSFGNQAATNTMFQQSQRPPNMWMNPALSSRDHVAPSVSGSPSWRTRQMLQSLARMYQGLSSLPSDASRSFTPFMNGQNRYLFGQRREQVLDANAAVRSFQPQSNSNMVGGTLYNFHNAGTQNYGNQQSSFWPMGLSPAGLPFPGMGSSITPGLKPGALRYNFPTPMFRQRRNFAVPPMQGLRPFNPTRNLFMITRGGGRSLGVPSNVPVAPQPAGPVPAARPNVQGPSLNFPSNVPVAPQPQPGAATGNNNQGGTTSAPLTRRFVLCPALNAPGVLTFIHSCVMRHTIILSNIHLFSIFGTHLFSS